MLQFLRSAAYALTSCALLCGGAAHAQSPSVKLIHTVALPGYSGDFDHFAVDFDRNRLLLAAEDHGTLEVFDLKTSAHLNTIKGFGNPHAHPGAQRRRNGIHYRQRKTGRNHPAMPPPTRRSRTSPSRPARTRQSTTRRPTPSTS